VSFLAILPSSNCFALEKSLLTCLNNWNTSLSVASIVFIISSFKSNINCSLEKLLDTSFSHSFLNKSCLNFSNGYKSCNLEIHSKFTAFIHFSLRKSSAFLVNLVVVI
jgi:hypothetical protein